MTHNKTLITKTTHRNDRDFLNRNKQFLRDVDVAYVNYRV